MLTSYFRSLTLMAAGLTLGVTAAACIYGDLPYSVGIPVGIAVTIIAALGDR